MQIVKTFRRLMKEYNLTVKQLSDMVKYYSAEQWIQLLEQYPDTFVSVPETEEQNVLRKDRTGQRRKQRTAADFSRSQVLARHSRRSYDPPGSSSVSDEQSSHSVHQGREGRS